MNDTPQNADVGTLSFEAAMAELETIVRQLEGGQVPLDATIALYDRATALKRQCDTRLREAEMRIEKLVAGSNGAMGTAPFDDAS